MLKLFYGTTPPPPEIKTFYGTLSLFKTNIIKIWFSVWCQSSLYNIVIWSIYMWCVYCTNVFIINYDKNWLLTTWSDAAYILILLNVFCCVQINIFCINVICLFNFRSAPNKSNDFSVLIYMNVVYIQISYFYTMFKNICFVFLCYCYACIICTFME